MRISVAPRGLLPAFRKGAANRPASRAAHGAVAGMQGAKPLAKDNLESPPSPEGKGDGGMGAEGSYEVGANRRWQGTGIPSGTGNRPASRAASGSDAGMQGAKPLAKDNLESPPSPAGKGVGGMGARTVIQEPGKPPTRKKQRLQRKNFQTPLTNREKCGILPPQ